MNRPPGSKSSESAMQRSNDALLKPQSSPYLHPLPVFTKPLMRSSPGHLAWMFAECWRTARPHVANSITERFARMRGFRLSTSLFLGSGSCSSSWPRISRRDFHPGGMSRLPHRMADDAPGWFGEARMDFLQYRATELIRRHREAVSRVGKEQHSRSGARCPVRSASALLHRINNVRPSRHVVRGLVATAI